MSAYVRRAIRANRNFVNSTGGGEALELSRRERILQPDFSGDETGSLISANL